MSAEDRMREIVMSRLKFPKIVGWSPLSRSHDLAHPPPGYTIIEEIGGGGYARRAFLPIDLDSLL